MINLEILLASSCTTKEFKEIIQTCVCPAYCPKCFACSWRVSHLYRDFYLSKKKKSEIL